MHDQSPGDDRRPRWHLYSQKALREQPAQAAPSWPRPPWTARRSDHRQILLTAGIAAWQSRRRIALAAVTVVIAGFLTLWGWTWHAWSRADWGAVWGAIGQWVGGVGALAAVLVAVAVARREAERFREETRATQQREDRASRTQATEKAALVLAEVTWTPEWAADPTTPEWIIRIWNHGREPILLPRLENFVHPAGGTVAWEFDDARGDWEESFVPPTLLAPGEKSQLPVKLTYAPQLTKEEAAATRIPIPIIGYTDSSGRRWRRTGTMLPVDVRSGDGQIATGPAWYRVFEGDAVTENH